MNREIEIHFKHSTTSIFFDNKPNFVDYFDKDSSIMITDKNIFSLYEKYICNYEHIVLEVGESSKSFDNVLSCIDKLINYKANRTTQLIGFGGGMICDLTGFVASIYQRGIKHSFVPTSLIAMIDASLGGKTSINYNNTKNLIGTFKHPEKIIINSAFIDTLPDVQFKSGIFELIKIALINDYYLLKQLLATDLSQKNNVDLSIIYSALLNKSQIVIKDENDYAIRKILNFGHSFGHLIEAECNYPHGISIAYGMLIALSISNYYSMLNDDAFKTSFSLITKYLDDKYLPDFKHLITKLVTDKKATSECINFILLKELGQASIQSIKISELEIICKNLYFPEFS